MFNDIDQNTKATMTLEWRQPRQFPRVLWDFNLVIGDMLSGIWSNLVERTISWFSSQGVWDNTAKGMVQIFRVSNTSTFPNYGRKEFDADEAYSLLLSIVFVFRFVHLDLWKEKSALMHK